MSPPENPKHVCWPLVALVLLAGMAIIGLAIYRFRSPTPLPQPTGRIQQESSKDWGHIVVPDSHCVLINNVWNKAAAGAAFQQDVFAAEADGQRTVGWRWHAPWQMVPNVISQPQIVCGDKPWDEPLHLLSEFPFHAGSKKLTADFDIKLQASGTYNMVFSLWAVRALPATRSGISHEIMIWNANSGQTPAGAHRGTLNVQGTTYDVYVEENHRDNSGANANVWTYVAIVAQKPVLHGPLDMSAFLDYLLQQGILSRNDYVTSLELGNEVCNGTGIVEIKNFAARVQ